MRAHWTLVLLALGCVAQPGERLTNDDLTTKQEARVGAACIDDSGCESWEHCNRIVCITTPCPSDGTCQNITRWYDNEGAAIPDDDPTGVTRTISVDRPASTVANAHVSVNIDHTWRGDLRVVLRSPAGTEEVLHDRTGRDADDLNLGVDVTRIFEGETAVGDWQLVVSDHAAQDTGRLLTWRLELDYVEGAPEPVEDGRDVWAQVEVPTIASEHDYANDTDQVWDLTPFSGGAERARIRFSRLETERGYDFVEILDQDTGAVLDRFDGDQGAFTTREYETGNLGIRLVTDYSVTAWGFAMEYVETFGLGCLADDDCGPGLQCPTEVVRCIRFPCFLSCQPEASSGGEGDACDSSLDCDADLYCGAGGTCERDGSCPSGDVAECSMEGNDYPVILCVGTLRCEAGGCGIQCHTTEICAEGEVRDDGCNTCTCSGGAWACTERYCPPVVGEGEACGAGTVCDEGLVCDRGRTTGVTCSSDQTGVCVLEPPRPCTREYVPVCACNGQTFGNECERRGIAPYAHEGACTLDVAIPDADAEGIIQRITVTSPQRPETYTVQVEIDHSWRGDLIVWLDDPDGTRHVLTNREGGSADGFEYTGTFDVGPSGGLGTYTLHVSDNATYDTGVLRFFNVRAN